jgi:hypothetical protein
MGKRKVGNIRPAVIFLLLLCLIIFLASCVPEFAHPLPADDRQADNLLLGDWRMFEDGKVWHLSIFSRPDGWMDLFLTAIDSVDSNSNGTLIFEGYSVPVNAEKYLCLHAVAAATDSNYVEEPDPNLIPNWPIVRYAVFSHRLHVIYLSAEPFKKLIIEDKLKGHIKRDLFTDSVSVTASSHELKKVFTEECITPLVEGVDMTFERSSSGCEN